MPAAAAVGLMVAIWHSLSPTAVGYARAKASFGSKGGGAGRTIGRRFMPGIRKGALRFCGHVENDASAAGTQLTQVQCLSD